MVQLNTKYDKTLKQKIFVLKGEEAYARTTDVLADIISDFDDCNTHIIYCRVGLEVDVLREVGDAFVNIYDDDTMLLSIPWGEDMESIINNSYYNDKGIYWQGNKLVIGSSDNVDTGLFLSYDTLHNIQVKYTGNKQCLSSKSDVISFMEEKPDSYASSISAVASSVSVETGDSVVFTLNLSIPTSDIQHTVQVYDNGSLIDTLSIDANEDVSYSKSGLSNGLHSIRFLFIGDEEAFSSEATVDVSVGYKLLLVDVPSYVVNGTSTSVGVSLTDYLDNPLESKTVQMIDDDGEISQSSATTDENGYVLIEPVYVGSTPIRAVYMSNGNNYYSEKVTVPVYTPQDLQLSRTYPAGVPSDSITVRPVPNSIPVSFDVPITISSLAGVSEDTIRIDKNSGYGVGSVNGNYGGDVTVTASIGSVSKSITFESLYQYLDYTNSTIGRMDFGTSFSLNYFERTSTDYGIKFTNNNAMPIGSLASITFPLYDVSTELTFKIHSLNTIDELDYKYQLPNESSPRYVSFDVAEGDIVTINRRILKVAPDYHHVSIKVNGVEKFSYNVTLKEGHQIVTEFNGYMIWNLLKVKRISDYEL